MRKENGVIVPYDRISAEALQALLEESVSREGTDSGDTRQSLAQKVDQLRRQLARGDAVIVYDLVAETANIVLRRDLERPGR
ncbi:MAG: YheU family protein [Desulfobacterales bacterium]|jgi:uncharacterized protein YheU (UPF0270 family)